MRCDVAIVGGGPVGCLTASHLAERFEILVIEEHQEIGLPTQCAGLITERVVRMAGAEDTVLNHIRGADIHFPGGGALRIRSPEVKAVVVDRERFDKRCAERAREKGARILLDTGFHSCANNEDGMHLKCLQSGSELDLDCRLLVGADGYKSAVARARGFASPTELVRGIQVDLDVRLPEQGSVQVYLGSEVAPGFFAWCIPCGDVTRAGLCVAARYGNPNKFLKPFLERAGLKGGKRVQLYSGAIPLGPKHQLVAERTMLVGDAAAQAKPLSGGGLYPGLEAAKLVAKVASEALDDDDLSRANLRTYERSWNSGIGKEIRRGYQVRKAFLRLNDAKLDQVFSLLDHEQVRSILERGDIDHPMDIAPSVLRAAPGLMRFIPQALLGWLGR